MGRRTEMQYSYKFPPIDEFVLDTGLHVILVPDSEQDGLVIDIQFPFGTFSDGLQSEGTAELCVGLMQKGSGGLNSEQFSEKLEYAGASIFSDLGEEHVGLGMRMLSKNEQEIFPLFWDFISKPRFEQQEFDRIQREMITSLQAETSDPGIIANRHFYRELAGKEHPAGRFYSVESIKKIQLSDLVAFYKEHFSPDHSFLVVAGNFDPVEFKKRWLPLMNQWKPGISKRLPAAPAVQIEKSVIRLVNKPSLTQASIVIGHHAPGELFAHRNEIALANYILGAGNFSSRLMTKIRTADGKTYGINSQIASEKHFGAFLITTSTQNSQVGVVVKSIIDVYNEFCKNGVTENELENAKKFAIGNMSFQLEGIGNVAEKLLWLRFFNRPDSYIEDFGTIIENITLSQINSVIQTCLSADKLLIVVVGKSSEIKPQIKDFGVIKAYHFRDKF
jgi:zinc protease